MGLPAPALPGRSWGLAENLAPIDAVEGGSGAVAVRSGQTSGEGGSDRAAGPGDSAPGGDLTFESALDRLQQIAEELEGEAISLDRSLELFAEGRRLADLCQAQLTEAEDRVRTLLKMAQGFSESPAQEES